MSFFKRFECRCATAPAVSLASPLPSTKPGTMTARDAVSPTSPARVLARSLTDPETRGEWARDYSQVIGLGGGYTTYKNAARDIRLIAYWRAYGDSGIRTPFTLSGPEEQIVRDAIAIFDKHLAGAQEAGALARLIAPQPPKPAKASAKK